MAEKQIAVALAKAQIIGLGRLMGSGSRLGAGDNASGQSGIGTRVDSNVAIAVTGLPAGVVDVRAGGHHSMALDNTGNL